MATGLLRRGAAYFSHRVWLAFSLCPLWHPMERRHLDFPSQNQPEGRVGLSASAAAPVAAEAASPGTRDKEPKKGGSAGGHGEPEPLQVKPRVPGGRKHGPEGQTGKV